MAIGDIYEIDLEDPAAVPNRLSDLTGTTVKALSGGWSRTLVITGEGAGIGLTHAVHQLSGLEGQLAQVAFGGSHMLALTCSGQVYALGDGTQGQLGHGSMTTCSKPKLLTQLVGKAVVQVACGSAHSLALTQHGDVYAWGRGFEGQLGLGAEEVALCPRFVKTLPACVAVAAGGSHSAALSATGEVFCWGEALCGQVGTGRLSRRREPSLVQTPPIKSIACGCAPPPLCPPPTSPPCLGLQCRHVCPLRRPPLLDAATRAAQVPAHRGALRRG